MGSIIPSLSPSCFCNNQKAECDYKSDINLIRHDAIQMKERIIKLENRLENCNEKIGNKLVNIETNMSNKFAITEEKITRLEDKIDTKFDLVLLSMQHSAKKS